MKKKLITVISSILALLCLTVGLSACGNKNTEERIAAIEDKLTELADSVDSLDTDGRKSLEEKLTSLEEALKSLEDEIDEIQLKTECLCGRHDYDESKIKYYWNEELTVCYAEKGCKRCDKFEYVDDTDDVTYNGFILTAVFEEGTGIPSAKLDVRDASEMTAEQTAAAVRYMLTSRTDGSYCVTLKLPKYAESYYLNRINDELRAVDSVQLTLSGITTIYGGVFNSSSYLIDLTLGEGVKTIKENAFRDCNHLKSVTLSDSVNSIGRSAFENCGNLESITFGKGVTALNSERVFDGCGSIKNITFKSPITSICENNILSFPNTNDITLTVAGGQKVLENNHNNYFTETDNVLSGGKNFCERDFKEIIISAS